MAKTCLSPRLICRVVKQSSFSSLKNQQKNAHSMSWGHRSTWMVTGKNLRRELQLGNWKRWEEVNEKVWEKADFTAKTGGGVLWRKEGGGEEASLDELQFLMAHLLSQVVLPVQLTLFIYWWLQLRRQLHACCFSQNKHKLARCGNSGGNKSPIWYISGSVSYYFLSLGV